MINSSDETFTIIIKKWSVKGKRKEQTESVDSEEFGTPK